MATDDPNLIAGDNALNVQSDDLSYFLDIGAVSVFFGGSRPLSAATIYRLIKRGLIPSPVSIGGSSRWIQPECEEARKKMVGQRAGADTDRHR
jgi:predicted DNA-binding transcriptional regulator AlpA